MLARHEVAAILIRADYDPEASVWVAQSDDIPLVTEADTYELLCEKLPLLIQDVLEANDDARAGTEVPFEMLTISQSAPRAKVA